MKRSLLATLFLAPALLAAAGCSQGVNNIVPRVLNRPAQVALVCFEGSQPAPMERCANASTDTGISLFALIPQVARGEVAAIDLTAQLILDSDRRVPGFTFVNSGDIPVAIALGTDAAGAPYCTFVANRGSRDVVAIQTVRFRDVSLATAGAVRTVRSFDAAPQAMVFQDGALWLTFPDAGQVRRLSVTVTQAGCEFGDEASTEIIDLDPAFVRAPRAMVPAEPDVATLAVCNGGAPLAAVGGVEAPIFDPLEMGAAVPWEIEAAPDLSTLFIGDAQRARIYPISTAQGITPEMRAGAAVVTDSPVTDMAFTPPVPSALTAGAPMNRYLYAIDARDGSVMAYDFSDPAQDEYGALLAVNVEGLRPDRLAVTSPARVLTVVDSQPELGVCDRDVPRDPNVGALVLRGVFLAVGTTDGSLRMFDVFDRDAPCRAGALGAPSDTSPCGAPPNSADGLVYIRRHRPRIGQSLSAGVALQTAPTALVPNGLSAAFEADGSHIYDVSLASTGACSPGLGPVLTFADTTLICGVTDPWAARTEVWTATWEGSISGTGTTGNLRRDGDVIQLDVAGDLCARGVLGAAGAALTPADQPESGYEGDYLVITSQLPPDSLEDPICQALVGITDELRATSPVLIPIADALSRSEGSTAPGLPEDPYRTRISVDAGAMVAGRTVTIGEAFHCFRDELVDFEVRVRGALAVAGSRSGFSHRVVADATTARCQVDVTQSPTANGRGISGRTFVGERLQFTLAGDLADVRPTVRIAVSGTPRPIAADVGFVCTQQSTTAMPVDLLWSPIDSRLYVLDELRRGLVPFELPTLTPRRCYE